jgi:hypothetical protein
MLELCTFYRKETKLKDEGVAFILARWIYDKESLETKRK